MKYTLILVFGIICLYVPKLSATSIGQAGDPNPIKKEVNFYFPKNVYHFIIEEGIQEYYESLKTYLDENPDKKVLLVGFADDGSNSEWNTRLSKYRARKVRDSLVKGGILEDRIKIDYKGKESPLAKDDSPEELLKNRRVELRIM